MVPIKTYLASVSCRPGGRALPGGGAASTRRRRCGTSRTAFSVSWPTDVEQNTSDGLIKEESRKGAFFDMADANPHQAEDLE